MVTVTGGRTTRGWDVPSIGDRQFRNALQRTLAASGMFSEVRLDGAADLDLHATIVSQDGNGLYENDQTLFVHYDLVDRASRKVLLRTNVVSLYTMTVREAFVGHARMRASQEAVSRDNLTQLVERLVAALGP